jgi:hypothetical protein
MGLKLDGIGSSSGHRINIRMGSAKAAIVGLANLSD